MEPAELLKSERMFSVPMPIVKLKTCYRCFSAIGTGIRVLHNVEKFLFGQTPPTAGDPRTNKSRAQK
jgi:hypothetical protein